MTNLKALSKMHWNQIESTPGAILTLRSGNHIIDCRESQPSGLHYFKWEIFRDDKNGAMKQVGTWVQMRSPGEIGHDEIQSALGQADRIISEKSRWTHRR